MLFDFYLYLAFALSTYTAPTEAAPQTVDISGFWTGVITQDEGGYRSEYHFELRLWQEGDIVKGESRVAFDDSHATMTLEGKLMGKRVVYIKDTSIIDSKINAEFQWCMKSLQLVYKKRGTKRRLEGKWQGNTAFATCIPGNILVYRNDDQV